jgi:hypothetical protein
MRNLSAIALSWLVCACGASSVPPPTTAIAPRLAVITRPYMPPATPQRDAAYAVVPRHVELPLGEHADARTRARTSGGGWSRGWH